MAKPDNIESIDRSKRTNEKLTELYALWQRDYPDGVGKNVSLMLKDERIGEKPLWKLKGKIGYKIFSDIIKAIEKYYKNIKENGNN